MGQVGLFEYPFSTKPNHEWILKEPSTESNHAPTPAPHQNPYIKR